MEKLERVLIKILSPIIKKEKTRNYLWEIYNIPKRRIMVYKDKKKYNDDRRKYCQMNRRQSFTYNPIYERPFLSEYRGQAGYPNTYFWQDLWGASRILERKPCKHFDIGSRIDGFISHLMLLKIPTTLIDIRPLDKEIPGIDFFQADATELNNIENDSIESLSALCSLEHFGLGRYGDPIDPEACFKAFKSIQRVTKKDGYIYLSLPIGKERVCFNAHRVFEPSTIICEMNMCRLIEFSVIDMSMTPVIIENCDLDRYNTSLSSQMGLFIFQKN